MQAVRNFFNEKRAIVGDSITNWIFWIIFLILAIAGVYLLIQRFTS